MSGRDISGRRRLRAGAVASALLVGALPAAAIDLSGRAGTPATVPASRQCFADNVRVSGYVVPGGETYVSWTLDGYRISEILVGEGDAVAADQELIRVQPVSSGDAPPVLAGAPARAPGPIALRAPAAGTVARSTARLGAPAKAGSEPLMRITTDPALDLVVDIPSLYAARVRAGSGARLLLEEGREVATSVRVPASDVDPGTQFGRARIAVPGQAGLRPGLFAPRAAVDIDRSCGVGVPRSTLLRQNNATAVVVERNGRAEMRPVQLGLSSSDSVEIRGGLAEGEKVLTNAAGAF